MTDQLRLFFAIEIPEEIKDEVEIFSATLDRCWRPVKFAKLHVTLAFMGAVSSGELANVIEAGKRAAHQVAAFGLNIADTGVFPETGEPRVLYAQVSGGSELETLANCLRQDLGRLADQKKFRPHLTLARCRSGRTARRILRRLRGSWLVNTFVLLKSNLSADDYEEIARFTLSDS